MKLAGGAVLHATPQQVWSALNDPATLARCIPGCESLERTADDEYKMTVSAGVASIRGTYDGVVRLTDKQEPTSYVMHASGAGGPGTVSATCTITLSGQDDGTTELAYDADAVVGGVVAGVGQRMITGVAKKMAGQFFGNVDAELVSGPALAAQPVVEAASAATQAVYAGRAAASGPSSGELAIPMAAASATVGGLVALLGVLLGWLIGRRRP